MGFKKANFTIRMRTKDSLCFPKDVTGWTDGEFYYHNAGNSEHPFWNVTDLPTGLAIIDGCRSRAEAAKKVKEVIKELEEAKETERYKNFVSEFQKVLSERKVENGLRGANIGGMNDAKGS